MVRLHGVKPAAVLKALLWEYKVRAMDREEAKQAANEQSASDELPVKQEATEEEAAAVVASKAKISCSSQLCKRKGPAGCVHQYVPLPAPCPCCPDP